jgi:ribonuclease P protein component
VRREENVSAQQSPAQADARLPGADAHARRSTGAGAPAEEGSQAADRLSQGSGERLRRHQRVRRGSEYQRAYRAGRRRNASLATLHFVPNETEAARLGVTVSRKVGNSVVRHRVKRRIVEAWRRAPWRATLPAWDFVVHVKPAAAEASFASLRGEIEALFGGAVRERRR